MSAEAQIIEYSLREEELHQLLVRAHNGEDPEKLTTDWCTSRWNDPSEYWATKRR